VNAIPDSTLFAALFVLLLVSAFFSISETSMMALNRYRLRHLVASGHRGATLASALLASTDRFLGVVLLGNNVTNAASALLVGVIAERYLGENQWSLFVATTVAAFVILVFSEITPKVVGAAYPERIALPASYVLTPLLKLLRPVVWFVNLFVQALLRLLWIRPRPNAGEVRLSPEELRTLVLEASRYIPPKHQSILLNLFELESITVDDVMIPRAQMEAVDINADPELLHRQIATAYHRQLAVYDASPDNVVGVIRTRNVFNIAQDDRIDARELRSIMREPYFIPSGTPLFTQLQQFQESGDRLGFVVDEYGELQGLVTVEDILEEIAGEFTTQSPLRQGAFAAQADGSYLVEGGTLLRELNRKLGCRFPLDGPKTLNGLILEHLQDIPAPDVSLRIGEHTLEIVQTQGRAVKMVRLLPPAQSSPAAGE
jgi:Mg2+/Co2+ transporter CorB